MSGDEDERAEDGRDGGVAFEGIDSVLEEISYPVSKDEFVDRYGERTLDRTNAEPITVRAVFEGTGDDTFESADDIRRSVLNLVPSDSVGRQRYSDRGGYVSEESGRDTDLDPDESV